MKYEGLNLLRGIAAFCIVAVHLNMVPMTDWAWRVHDICDMNVGLFAAISGFLMYKPIGMERFRDYVKKRCYRLLPVYFVWTLVFILFGFAFDFFVRHGINEKWMSWSYYPKVLFGGQVSAHLWFLICLLYVQIFIRCVERWLRVIGWLCTLCLGFLIVCLASFNMDIWIFGYPVRMLGFVMSGYAIGMRIKEDCLNNKYVLAYSIIAVIFIFAHLLIKLPRAMTFVKDWFVSLSILAAVVSLPESLVGRSNCVKVLGATSMGVYLIHPIITAGIGIAAKRVFVPPFGLRAIMVDWLICYVVSLVLAAVMYSIPKVNRFIK